MKELRFVALPFSGGCVSQSSVAVLENRTKRAVQAADAAAALALPSGGDGGQSFIKRRSASFSGIALSFLRPNVAAGFHKLIRGFRSLSQQFLVYREEDDGREEMEMVIGFPTDVQHIGHIGWNGIDGVAGAASTVKKSWEKDEAPEFLPFPSCSFSLQQFELTMAAPAQTAVSPPPRCEPIGACPQ